LNKEKRIKKCHRCGSFDHLRKNEEIFFSQISNPKLMNFLEKFNQKKLTGRINRFWSYIKNA